MALKRPTREEIEEVLLLMCVYAGFNKAAGCFGVLNELFANPAAADGPDARPDRSEPEAASCSRTTTAMPGRPT